MRNLTTGEAALHERLAPEGGFDAVVALAPGANQLAIRARTETGLEVQGEFSVTYQPGAASQAPPVTPSRRGLRRDAPLERVERTLEGDRGGGRPR